MSALDFLYLSLAIGFLILVVFLSITSLRLSQTLKEVSRLVSDIEDITTILPLIKGGLLKGTKELSSFILNKLKRRGEK